jgi:hypothetical protein
VEVQVSTAAEKNSVLQPPCGSKIGYDCHDGHCVACGGCCINCRGHCFACRDTIGGDDRFATRPALSVCLHFEVTSIP